MQIQGAVIKEQGVTFSIVVVKHHVTQTNQASESARSCFRRLFPGMTIVLASQDSSGNFEFQGRKDLVEFLASIHPSQIPWKEYTLS